MVEKLFFEEDEWKLFGYDGRKTHSRDVEIRALSFMGLKSRIDLFVCCSFFE